MSVPFPCVRVDVAEHFAQLKTMSKVKKTRDTVVLIHGLGRTQASMLPLSIRLESAGFRTSFAGYKWVNMTLEQGVERVSRQVERVARRYGGPIHLVGHSLGGIIALHLKRSRPDLPIHRVVQFGSPNLGSSVAENLKSNSLATWFFGPIVSELSEDLTTSPQRDPDVAAIAGDEFPVGVAKVYGVSEPNDGLVTVRSAWGHEAGLRLTAHTIHTGLPLSRSVAHATVEFLQTGHAEIPDD